MINKKNKGNSFIRLPLLFIALLFIIIFFLIVSDFSSFFDTLKQKNKTNNQNYHINQKIPKTFNTQGIILDINKEDSTILINHNKIEGYRDAFDNSSTNFYYSELENLIIGDSISFRIFLYDVDSNNIVRKIDADLMEITYLLGKSSMPIYDVTGVIKEIQADNRKLLIDHEEIYGFMDKMIMFFNVHESVKINNFEIGDSVNFKLFITQQNHFTISYDKIGESNIVDSDDDDDDFWKDTNIYAKRDIGEILDDATFLTSEGNEISIHKINSEIKLISFIFSRCPIPNMCPAVIRNNQYLASQFNGENIKFIIISFDYLYDTPRIIENNYNFIEDNNNNIIFLSSYQHINELYQLSSQIGYDYWGIDTDNIGHINRHVLINNENVILKFYDGFEIKASDIKRDIENYFKN